MDVILDRTHPLAKGLISAFLLNEGSGVTVRDFATPSRTSTLAAGASWTQTPYGPAVVPSSTAAQKNSFSSNPTTSGIPFTASIILKHTGSDAGFAGLLTDLTTWGLYIHGNKLDLDGGADPDSTTTLTTGNFYHCVWYWDGTNAAYAVNGLRDSGGGANTGITNPAVFTGWGGDGTNPAQNNTFIAFWIWERVLTDVESGSHYADPFGMFRSPPEEARSFSIVLSRPVPIWTPPVHLFSPPAGGGSIVNGSATFIDDAKVVQTAAQLVDASNLIDDTQLVQSGAQILDAASLVDDAQIVQSGARLLDTTALIDDAQLAQSSAIILDTGALIDDAKLVESSAVILDAAALVDDAQLVNNTAQVVDPSAPIIANAVLLGNVATQAIIIANAALVASGTVVSSAQAVANAVLVATAARILDSSALAGEGVLSETAARIIATGLIVQANAVLAQGVTVIYPPPSATVAASSPSGSVQIGTPAATATSSNPTATRGGF